MKPWGCLAHGTALRKLGRNLEVGLGCLLFIVGFLAGARLQWVGLYDCVADAVSGEVVLDTVHDGEGAT